MLASFQALLASLATSFDFPILEWIQAHLQSPVMDTVMPIITLFGEYGIFVIATALVLVLFPKTRKTGWAIGLSLALGLLVCNVLLKPAVARIRPYTLYAELYGTPVKLLVKESFDYSFPSGHAIAMFEWSTVILMKNKWLGLLATLLAVAVSFSRLYLFVHYPTDVLISVVLGILFGILGVLIVEGIYKLLPENKGGKYLRK